MRTFLKKISLLCCLIFLLSTTAACGGKSIDEFIVDALNDDNVTLSEEIEKEVKDFLNIGDGSGNGKENKEPTTGQSPGNTNEPSPDEFENEIVFSDGKLEIHFIDVSQADSTLILCDGEAMLIDAGNNHNGTLVQNYIFKQGVGTLKYVVGTHPDADHYGGLDVIITKFDCENVMLPTYKKDTRVCEDVYKAIEYKNYSVKEPVVGDTFSLGGAKITVIAPCHYDYEDNANNYSIGLLMEYGSNKFLFTGDAEEEAENDMLASGFLQRVDVYKVGHHGSYSSTTDNFLSVIQPKYAVISCGVDNDYGHPHASVLNGLRINGVDVFRTDEQGSIICYSDGTNITFNCSPSTTWKSGR